MLSDRKTQWIGEVSYKTLPKIGYIAIIGNHPVAAGFLRKVEGGYGQLDTFVSNPYFGSKARNEALDKIVNLLLTDADENELLGVIAITQDAGILLRSKNYGFAEIKQVIIGKNLSRK